MAQAKSRAKSASKKSKKKRSRRKKKGCAACKRKTCAALYEKHKKTADSAKNNGTKQSDIDAFKNHYDANQARYQTVADATGVPAPLVAAIHWREGSGNFGTYLDNGDPLGAPRVHVPSDGPTYQKGEWEQAAIYALNRKKACAKSLGMDKDTTDKAKMAAYAEAYNGTGYDSKGVPSPYVYSGTDDYTSGKYVADGQYSAGTVDKQTGVIPLIDSVSP